MAKNGNLVIVESPTKAKSIGRILGDDYVVEASYGHVRDLPKSKLGVDLATFQPEYVVPPDAKKRVAGYRDGTKTYDWKGTPTTK